ncbi:MAG: ABC transporter permease [Oscillospiraceae bacterium]|nr:ABC transporter permease [Oscillospiraceae bacterium]
MRDGTLAIQNKKRKKDHTILKLVVLLLFALAIVFIAIFGQWLTPHDPYAQNLAQSLAPPSSEHLLGCDRFGRDLLSRVITGTQTTIFSAFVLVAGITILGTLVGIIAGFVGGWIDSVLMRISDIFLAFPEMVFAISVAGVIPGGIWAAVIAVGLIAWPRYARIARSQVLAMKNNTYMSAAKLCGCRWYQVTFKHIFPNILGPIIVTAALDIGAMIMNLAGLSFLGLGAKPPIAEWGSMMSESRSSLQTAPWAILAPGLAIFITVLIFNLLGDTVRDILDPKQKRRSLKDNLNQFRRLFKKEEIKVAEEKTK